MAGGTAEQSARVTALALTALTALAAFAAGSALRAEDAGAAGREAPPLPGEGTSGTGAGAKGGKGKMRQQKVKMIGPSYVRQQWALRAIRAKHLQLKKHRALNDVLVATIDSGVALNHPDLRHSLWHNPFPTPAPEPVSAAQVPAGASGWAMLAQDPTPSDTVGHGTAVAGLIAAEQNNGGIDGVAPNAELMPMRACWRPAGGDLTCTDSGSASAINWAADHGARIIHLSWTLGGGPLGSGPVLSHPHVLFL